jgi:hypothetical protein
VPSQYGPLLPYLIPVLVLLLVVRRGMTARKVKIESMWVMPALLIFAGASMFASAQIPSVMIIGELAAALAGGAVVGWYRGRLTHITIDPATHDLTSKTSPVGLVLVAVLFAARYGIRLAFPGAGYGQGSLGSQAGAIADALTLFGIGAMVVQRLEMWIRCRRLLAEAKGAKAV